MWCLCSEENGMRLAICWYLTSIQTNISFSVIRAKISGEKIVSPSNSSSPYLKMIQYEIKMIKVSTPSRCITQAESSRHISHTGDTFPHIIIIPFDQTKAEIPVKPTSTCHMLLTRTIQDRRRYTDFLMWFLPQLNCCRCLRVSTRPKTSSTCTLPSSPPCVASSWIPTIKFSTCCQVCPGIERHGDLPGSFCNEHLGWTMFPKGPVSLSLSLDVVATWNACVWLAYRKHVERWEDFDWPMRPGGALGQPLHVTEEEPQLQIPDGLWMQSKWCWDSNLRPVG